MSILALCPSRGRPKAAHETLASFLETRRDKRSRIVFIVDSDDPTRHDYPEGHTHVVSPTGCMGGALRIAQTDLVKDATSVGMIGDDNRFRTPGWDLTLDGYLTEHIGVAYGDDGLQHERLPTSWWVSRKLADAFPIAPTVLDHLYMDNWWKSLAEGAGCLRYFPDVYIEHLHPLAGKAPDDATYRRGNSRLNALHDRDQFKRWERRQRPFDVKRARGIIGDGQKRRVLADWHHPALWESLAILFEDRFGWELFSMGGNGWLDHGWRLRSGPPISWAPEDYLCLDGAIPRKSYLELGVPEYPDRPRKVVTPEQAFSMRWDYVLGSVPQHQTSFSRLAKTIGARFINQIGNARYDLEQGPDQIVLASANVKVRGRTPHVIYHQEFNRSVFAPAPITEPLAVSSLMLRLDWTSCDYRWLADAPGIRWSAPGGQDPAAPEYLAPMSKVADVMRASGWIWHDKRIGDGYGHVLFNAAAMGRPVIGHGSHFRGLMGEPFWKDLRTCIDLDVHEPTEALRLIRAIAADPDWHAEMSANMVETFDDLVDFDAEALAIREVLD